jgi:hypothetical protein
LMDVLALNMGDTLDFGVLANEPGEGALRAEARVTLDDMKGTDKGRNGAKICAWSMRHN